MRFPTVRPDFELLAGVAVLAAAFALASWRPAACRCDSATAALASALRKIGFFPVSDLEIEVRRLDLLRIALAFLLLQRCYQDLSGQIFAGNTATIGWFALGTGLAGLLCVGFATPLAALLLGLLLNLIIDNYTFNSSLGSMVIAICLIPMIAVPAGRSLSIDAVLMRQDHALGRSIRSIYEIWGGATVDRIQVARFLSLLAFGGICIYSALKHLVSPSWTSGIATSFILLSPVSNQQYARSFQKFYEFQPQLFILFGFVSTYGMILWQLFLVPLVLLNYWTRLVTIVWGLLFFLLSTYVLSIKTLGVYEFVLWALVFWSQWKIGLQQKHGLLVIFTDRYARLVRFVRAVDLFRAIEFRPGSAGLDGEHGDGLSTVSSAGAPLVGYDVLCAIVSHVLVLLPLWPLLQLGRIAGFGRLLYARLAGSSTRSLTSEYERPALAAVATGRIANTILIAFAVLFFAYAVRLPFVSSWSSGSLAGLSQSLLGQAPLIMGLGPIDVFNELDLKVYRNNSEIYHRSASGEIKGVAWPAVFKGEAQKSLMTQKARKLALQQFNCAEGYVRTAFSILDQNLPADHAFRDGLLYWEFMTFDRPTRDDFLKFEYVPFKGTRICRVSGSLKDINSLSTHFHPGGIERLRRLGMAFEPTDERMKLAERFPCVEEVARAAYWFDRPGGTVRDAADVAALRLLFKAKNEGPLSCLFTYQALVKRMDMEPSQDAAAVMTGTCEGDLSSAEAYLLALGTDEALGKSLAEARAASAAGQTGACLLAAAEVRRSYLDRFRDEPQTRAGIRNEAVARPQAD